MLIQLPNGLLDGMDLFNYAEIDELRGKQQNYLADKDLVIGNIGHIPKILEDMVLSFQTKEGFKWNGKISEGIYKLPAGDIETILIKVRENTYGPRFYHEAECTHCKHINKNLRLDLDKLKLDIMPLEKLTKKKDVVLPKSKMIVELKPAYLKDFFEIVRLTHSNKHNTIITSLLSTSIAKLGIPSKEKEGEHVWVSPVKNTDIDSIPASDLVHLQEKMREIELEGSIDTDIEVNCSNCSQDFRVKLNPLDPNFFDPTRVSQS
jgi:hypothetical protein